MARSRRILLTGLSTYWGGRLAETLERDPEIDVIVGVDTRDPTRELERTEFVRVGTQHALIRRIVQAARIDTVIDTRLTVDSINTSAREAHENNVIGTMNILAACSGPDTPVRKLIFKSSAHWYGCEQDDPAFFTEEMRRPHPPRTRIERDIVEAESSVHEFSARNRDTTVTVLRFCNGLGAGLRTSHSRLFSLPAVPTILGFDPRYQFIHEDDIVGCLELAVRRDLDGVYNGAADGVLVLSEVVDLLGKQMAPVIPPVGTELAAALLRRLGLRIPSEMLNQMRFGRALDNRKLKAAGYRFRYTTRETVDKLREHQRLGPLLRGAQGPYRYEREVEEFLRWSPSVHGSLPPGTPRDRQIRPSPAPPPARPAPPPAPPPAPEAIDGAAAPYDELGEDEVIGMLGSLERADLLTLRAHEAAAQGRPRVLRAIDAVMAAQAAARRASPAGGGGAASGG
jgi:UDP-glucose 4-epimerase